MGWQEDIDRFCAWLVAGGGSVETVRLRRHYLRRLAERHADPWSVTLDDLVAYVATPQWAPETRKAARSTVRGFYRWAALTDRVTKDPSVLLPPVPIPPTKPRPAPDFVLARALIAASPRDALMVCLAAYAGLRRAEIATLHTAHIVADELHLVGKGRRGRIVPLHPQLQTALGIVQPGWVFPGRIDGHLSPGHVGKVLSRLLGPGWTGHKLRHRFASRAYAVERDLYAVQQLLGHSRPETTARYVALPDDALRAAVLGAA